ncbi:MAG: hypothetical protein M5R38_01695 [Candidatus Methylomirabilis sp.]|nr:hypothetical protein [Candidatus Methylomirabilis sp.]
MPFHDVVGQTRAIGFLQRALATGRIAHAYLFSGPAGVGNCAAALAFAQALNCEEGGPTPNPQPPNPRVPSRLTPYASRCLRGVPVLS